MIECKDLCVSIGGKTILNQISFHAKEGEITSVIGRNGSGKTTLLSAIQNTIKYNGNIFIHNNELRNIKSKELSKKIALMPQILPTPDISVEELVSFGRTPYTHFSGILSAFDKEKVNNAMTEAGIAHLAKRNLLTLSGGERQRAFFAMILAQETDIIMADEPTTYMDVHAKKELLTFLCSLKNKGKTVIIVLHDINDAVSISDKINLLDGGQLVFSGSTSEFTISDFPQKIFALKKITVQSNGQNEYFFK